MVSFDPSTMNIVLTGAVIGLFIFFLTLLIKLNPSSEKKEDVETEFEVERQKPPQTLPTAPQNPQPQPARIESPRVMEKPLVAVGPTMGGTSVQTRQEPPAPTLNESRVIPRPPEKTAVQAKTGSAPSKRDCLHHFGYLRTFPKNSPIPDECFGCEKIVDCLVNNKKSKER